MGSGLTKAGSKDEETPEEGGPVEIDDDGSVITTKKPKPTRHKARGHGRDSTGSTLDKRPTTSSQASLKKKADEHEDKPVMDLRLYNWLPHRAQNIDEDREALRTIFTGCDGEKWYIKIGWKTYDDPARWFGVSVERTKGAPRVRGLDLKSNELVGKIPRELGSLVKLKTLNLEGNSLTGPVPAPVVLMTQNQLTSWSLKGNAGLSLPSDIGAITVLQTLNMPMQNLTGKVPGGLAYLKCLKSIDLSQNRLTGRLRAVLEKFRLPCRAHFPLDAPISCLASVDRFRFSNS